MWIAALFIVTETALVLSGWRVYGVDSGKDALPGKKAGLVAVAAIMTSVFNILMLQKDYSMLTRLNLGCIYTLLGTVALVDFRTHRIPNRLVLAGMAARTALLAADIYMDRDSAMGLALFALVGLAFGLGVMLLLSLLTRRGIGYGDVKLFSFIGYSLGFIDTYNVLFYSALYAAAAGIYLTAVKKQGRRTRIPFAPFIFFGAYSVFAMQFMQ